jgi:hypothetical protein
VKKTGINPDMIFENLIELKKNMMRRVKLEVEFQKLEWRSVSKSKLKFTKRTLGRSQMMESFLVG